MTSYFRRSIAQKILQCVSGTGGQAEIARAVRLTVASKKQGCDVPQFSLPLTAVSQDGNEADVQQIQLHLQATLEEDLETVSADKRHLYFKIKTHKFHQHVLGSIKTHGPGYGYESQCGNGHKQRVVVEYSSPNIAKPFHAGHLRSTIIGNFIANLYEALGHSVSRINYLGDWGTQFGLLLIGYNRYGDPQELEQDPLLHLFQVYVKVNANVEQEQKTGNRQTYNEALQVFSRLEQGEEEAVKLWQLFRNVSLEEYDKIYNRLGVSFTAINMESDYQQQTLALLERLRQEGILQTDTESGVGYVQFENGGHPVRASLVKSDGTTLYLSRDVCAAIDRFKRIQFDKMFYVVEKGQQEHFSKLQGVLQHLGPSMDSRNIDFCHVGFGLIEGLSTRRGQVVFLRDVLDEAKQRMLHTLTTKESTKEDLDHDHVADILGISSVIVQDLRERRLSNYKFSMERMLNFKSDSGTFLQYCHARLCSVSRSFPDVTLSAWDPRMLPEDSAGRLVLHLARYPDTIQEAFSSLEPFHIVQYLFKLGHLSNAAYNQLAVKGQSGDTARARLLLFDCTRQTLANGLVLLGVQPLQKM